jgi:hypothetical protein
MKKKKSLWNVLNNYLGLIVLWGVVFLVTVFLVGILMQNWNLKRRLSALPIPLNSLHNPVMMNA